MKRYYPPFNKKFNDYKIITFSYVNVFIVKYLWLFILLLTLFTIWGAFIIVTYKKPAIEILGYLGGFVGGMFTFIAVLQAYKEYTLFKMHNGSKEFRSFVVESIRPISDEIKSDYFNLKQIYDEAANNQKDDLMLQCLFEKYDAYLHEMACRYESRWLKLGGQFNDASFHNKWLANKIKYNFEELKHLMGEFSFTVVFIQDFLLKSKDLNSSKHLNNPFIDDIRNKDNLLFSREKLFVDKVLLIVKQIDETQII